jgi:hypothetical protein
MIEIPSLPKFKTLTLGITNGEFIEGTLIVLPADIHTVYSGHAWAVFAPVDHGDNIGPVAFDNRLHRSIAFISNPSGDADHRGRLLGFGPEKNALYPSGNDQVRPGFLLHDFPPEHLFSNAAEPPPTGMPKDDHGITARNDTANFGGTAEFDRQRCAPGIGSTLPY